jgi:hypothetical protein
LGWGLSICEVLSSIPSTGKTELTFREYLQHSWHCYRNFTYTGSLNAHNKPTKKVILLYTFNKSENQGMERLFGFLQVILLIKQDTILMSILSCLMVHGFAGMLRNTGTMQTRLPLIKEPEKNNTYGWLPSPNNFPNNVQHLTSFPL